MTSLHDSTVTTRSSLAARRLGALGHRPGQNPSGSSLPTATRLWLDWADLSSRRRNIVRANSWSLPGEPVTHLDQVLERSGYGQGPTDEDCDAYLSALTGLAHHDPLAGRIVVQRILPGLISTAIRRGRIVHAGASGALDELVSAAWMVISRYPIDRRPHRVAANLLRDIEYQAFVRDSRTKRSRVEFASDNTTLLSLGTNAHSKAAASVMGALTGSESSDPTADAAELAIVINDLVRLGLKPIDLAAIEEMLTDQLSPDSARQLGISPRALRDRRATAIRRSRELLRIEVEDCSPPRTHSTEPWPDRPTPDS